MKRSSKILIFVLILVALAGVFYAGRFFQEQEHITYKNERCRKYILFAIDKAENMDISDSHVMEALISNVYAAHEFCDDVEMSAALSDLWNTLIFRGEDLVGQEGALAQQLREILQEME